MMWQGRRKRTTSGQRNRTTVRVVGQDIGVIELLFEDGTCVEAPERMAAAVGRSLADVRRYLWRRGWSADEA